MVALARSRAWIDSCTQFEQWVFLKGAMSLHRGRACHAVIVFSRTGDSDTGDFDDPVILAKHGDAPEHLG
jgi:hypothetical protein